MYGPNCAQLFLHTVLKAETVCFNAGITECNSITFKKLDVIIGINDYFSRSKEPDKMSHTTFLAAGLHLTALLFKALYV